MSFLKIKDPWKRDEAVAEFLKVRKAIQDSQLAHRLGKQEYSDKRSRRLKPLTDIAESQANISKNILEEVKKIPDVFEWSRERYTPAIEGPGAAAMETYGPTAREYMTEAFGKNRDNIFGIHKGADKNLYIGDTRIHVNGNNIIVGEKEYEGTKGLWELITMKEPDEYDDEDYNNYAKIMINTNAMKKDSGKPRSNPGPKWKDIISDIWKQRGKFEGKGVVILPSDAEALLDRLDLLLASKGAGNTGLGNEIVSICDELKRQKVLTVNAYKKIMSSL